MSHTDDCIRLHHAASPLGFVALARRIVARVVGWRRERATRAVLEDLTSDQLRDIGVERTEIGFTSIAPWDDRR